MDKPIAGVVVDASLVGAVDGYGIAEWRGIDLATGIVIFSYGRYVNCTINVAEFLALAEGLMYLHMHGDNTTKVYSDSKVAIDWIRGGKAHPQAPYRLSNNIKYFIKDIENWLQNESIIQVVWWDTQEWGENPADYGQKSGQIGKLPTKSHNRITGRDRPRNSETGRARPRNLLRK